MKNGKYCYYKNDDEKCAFMSNDIDYDRKEFGFCNKFNVILDTTNNKYNRCKECIKSIIFNSQMENRELVKYIVESNCYDVYEYESTNKDGFYSNVDEALSRFNIVKKDIKNDIKNKENIFNRGFPGEEINVVLYKVNGFTKKAIKKYAVRLKAEEEEIDY